MNTPADAVIFQCVECIAKDLRARSWSLSVAESCTGGWVAKACTDLAGSSQWFERGFVTYSNEAKQEMLGVRAETLHEYGAVSLETVAEMARGVLVNSRSQISLAISGIAGPGGATRDKPVGTVCFAIALASGETLTEQQLFSGDRDAVRRQAVWHGLQWVQRSLE